MFRFDGKTALVTGASQGIGHAIASHLAARGARVACAARSVDKLEALVAAIEADGGTARAIALDVSQAETVGDQLTAGLAGTDGDDAWTPDIVINNAGITRDGLFARMSHAQWSEVLTTNLTGSFAVTRALVRDMMRKRWGRVIFVSSVVGVMGNPGQVNYAASKAGMIGMAKSLAKELGSRGITVNVIAPGFIDTAMTEAVDERAKQGLNVAIVLRRIGRVDEIAAAAVYLASEEAGYVTGEVHNVSGGLYI
ncbi:MAG: 3-oxoacyl-ACP reductase FabG [Acidobacteriota bacterium]